jgi:hypothetical protein
MYVDHEQSRRSWLTHLIVERRTKGVNTYSTLAKPILLQNCQALEITAKDAWGRNYSSVGWRMHEDWVVF